MLVCHGLAGDAVGSVTPLGLLASEPTKMFLTRHDLATRDSLASVATENLIYGASILAMLAVAAGVVLVTVGVLCELAAIHEQPDLVQFRPNRFYTAADLRELEAAHQEFNDLETGRDLLTAENPSDVGQPSSPSGQVEDSQSAARAARLAAAQARIRERVGGGEYRG